MCGGCSSDNNQTNMTFQSWGVGMISLGVAAGVARVFHVGLMILGSGGSGRQRRRWRQRQSRMIKRLKRRKP
jgi:hypothetical protein